MFKKKKIVTSLIIFTLCLLVHAVEVLFIRTDETFFAECFINKVFGIIVLFVCLKLWGQTWRSIGFVKEKLLINCLEGFGLCAVFYSIGFLIEFLVLKMNGTPAHMEFFVTGFSLTGNVVKQTGFQFVLMCIFFNIINVWMEEGFFRGFLQKFIGEDYGKKTGLMVSALLFGLWHLITPFRSLIDGDMNLPTFLAMSVGYVILSAMMGIKWGILFEYSGTIWIGLADHFFNNCVVTNLLHVVTENGVDEMQIARVLIGELTSFVAVMIFVRKRK